jgi:hypothetical protein
MNFLLTQSDEETIEIAWSLGLVKAAIGAGDGYCQISGKRIPKNTAVTLYIYPDFHSFDTNKKELTVPYLLSTDSYVTLKGCLDRVYPRKRRSK